MVRQKKYSHLQLVNHLDSKGIKFEKCSKSNAIKFIDKNNYYYKISAFRKNFKKKESKYQHLDFEHLKDLASLDFQLRNLLLNISINTEHFIKTELTRQIDNNPKEDGYSIVKEFKNLDNGRYYDITWFKFKQSRYQNDMYLKRRDNVPYWVLLEHMDYGCLMKFLSIYYKKYKPRSLKKAYELGDNVRFIRNACAHNSVFIINVFKDDNKLNNTNAAVTTLAAQTDLLKYKNYKKVNDLLSLFALSKAYCSTAVRNYQKADLESFIQRCRRHEDDYKKNITLVKMFIIFQKIIAIS
ncbi:DNA-binding protein [Streptococcus parauberis]|nr:DNA-binding protein [Streptococcus parauberis]QBX27654.1 hypothetical protein Javan406_0004 [Streptococcus phage Javan406]